MKCLLAQRTSSVDFEFGSDRKFAGFSRINSGQQSRRVIDISLVRLALATHHQLFTTMSATEQEINKRLRTLHQDFDFLLDNNVISSDLYDQLVEKIPRRTSPLFKFADGRIQCCQVYECGSSSNFPCTRVACSG
jgi:hypothetical protein